MPLWRAYHLVGINRADPPATVRIRVDGSGLLGFKSGFSDGPSSPRTPSRSVAGVSVKAYPGAPTTMPTPPLLESL